MRQPLGDRAWRELLDRHDAVAGELVDRYQGRVIKETGDGVFATFDGPARAIGCATHLSRALVDLGLEIRAGLHTGECELRNSDVGGMAVHIGARIAGRAEPGQVLVSGTVKDLVVGSDIDFEVARLCGAQGSSGRMEPLLGRRRTRLSRGVAAGRAATFPRMRTAELELDLDVFAGPFDLLLAVVLREEINLLELDLAELVLAYLERLEETGELDLEAATEFLVLIASLLELKSRLLLPQAPDEPELAPEEAADELLARMLEYRRYRDAAAHLAELFAQGRRYHYRSAPLPPELRRVALEAARPTYEPDQLAAAIGDLLQVPPAPDTSHIRPTVSLERRLRALREVLARRDRFDFDEAFGSEDRLTQAVTLFALLELHKKGEATWKQGKNFGPIEVVAR